MKEVKEQKTEDLTQVLQVINAKGDTGELEEIVKDSFSEKTNK